MHEARGTGKKLDERLQMWNHLNQKLEEVNARLLEEMNSNLEL